MLTLPTRAKMVENQLGNSNYGNKLIYDIQVAMNEAMHNGRRSIQFTFDSQSLMLEHMKIVNSLFVEYLTIKKYKIVDIKPTGFRMNLI